jgi:hypothetical protein
MRPTPLPDARRRQRQIWTEIRGARGPTVAVAVDRVVGIGSSAEMRKTAETRVVDAPA